MFTEHAPFWEHIVELLLLLLLLIA